MPRKISVNRHLIDKNPPAEDRLYAEGFEVLELTLDEIAAEVKNGHALAPVCNGRRKAANFVSADIAWVDVDTGMTLDEALGRPFVKAHAGIIYTTANHTEARHRFRVGFPLAERITGAPEMAALQRSLALRIGGDLASTDAARIFFGNTGAQVRTFPGRQLTGHVQKELIAQSTRAIERGAAVKKEPATTRSALRLDPELAVKLAQGQVVAFSKVSGKTSIFCPFHDDNMPSAFTVTGRQGGRGVHCSTCRATFWCDDPSVEEDSGFDPFSFEEELLRLHADHRSYLGEGPLAALFGLDGRARVSVVEDGVGLDGTLPADLTFVRAPKGVGKTDAAKAMLADGVSALVVLHRRSLTRQVSRRLGLDCYLDVGDVGGDRIGICFDSLGRLPPDRRYGLVIIDEVEQVLAHILGDTIAADQRIILFNRLVELVRTARSVVVMDADIGWCSFLTLTRMRLGDKRAAQGDLFRPQGTARVALNVSKPGQGKSIRVFRSREHLVRDMLDALRRGERVFVAANTKTFADKLTTIVDRELGGLPSLLVTAATVGNERQQAFLADPAAEALKYQVIITSPAAGTGLDITFPGREVKIDAVYGFCEADVVTHWDFDQHLSRVRQPGLVKVWLSPMRLHYDTHRDVVRDDLLKGRLRSHVLLQKGRDQPELISDDLLIEMATLKVSEVRWSKNDIKKNFIAMKRRQGFDIIEVAPDREKAGEGRELLKLAKQLGAEELATRLLAARPLTWTEFERVAGTVEGGGQIGEHERVRYERTRMELFYRQTATAELIALDDRGRLRGRLALFAAVTEALPATPAAITERDAVIAERAQKTALTRELLSRTPLVKAGAWDVDATVTGEDLGSFCDFIEANRRPFETQLDEQARKDLRQKPVAQLRRILNSLGLSLELDHQQDRGAERQRFYRLDRAVFGRVSGMVARRRRIGHYDFMRATYDFFDDAEDEAAAYFDDAAE